MKTIIETRELIKNYALGNVEVNVLKGIDLKVNSGDFISIFGPSGSGKSTLLNMIGALDVPTSGKIVIDGKDITDMRIADLADVRAKVGFVFQFFNLIGRLTAIQNVELPMSLKKISKKERFERAEEILTMVGLENRIFHKPSELSGGEQQRVAIARALAQDPKYLLMDEPTGNVDIRTAALILNLIKHLNEEQKITTIIITHDQKISEITNRVCYIVDGKLYNSAEEAEDAENDYIKALYSKPVELTIQKHPAKRLR